MNKSSALKVSLATLSMALLFGCADKSSPAPEPEVGPKTFSGPSVTIMTFNVENLFDTEHDEGKNDIAYLPLAVKQADPRLMAMCEEMTTDYYKKECRENDWSEQVLDVKIERLANAILQISGGQGPDILLVQEIENENALRILRDRKLPNAGYVTLSVPEGDDERGIDVGIMSRLKEWDRPILHKIPFKGSTPKETADAQNTRGILESRLLLEDGQKISVFVVHFPSQGNPLWMRQQALAHLNFLMKNLPKDVLAIAGGDFNITKSEEAKEKLIATTIAPNWQVSHLVGCKGCDGTQYYNPAKEWSFFDILLFSPAMKTGGGSKWILDTSSIRIPNAYKEQTNQFGSPNRFTVKTGVSDHWPMFARIVRLP